jgi:hypothetical protein
MRTPKTQELIEKWLSFHHDHTVRIERWGDNDIVARSEYNCRMEFIRFEYVEYVSYCPCCEQKQDIYHNFDDIDFSGSKLSFEDSSGAEVKMYDVANKVTTWSFETEETELSEQEVDDFFDKDWASACSWSEGEGRGQSHYEIMSDGACTRIISVQHYGFDDFMQPKYFLINN